MKDMKVDRIIKIVVFIYFSALIAASIAYYY